MDETWKLLSERSQTPKSIHLDAMFRVGKSIETESMESITQDSIKAT